MLILLHLVFGAHGSLTRMHLKLVLLFSVVDFFVNYSIAIFSVMLLKCS